MDNGQVTQDNLSGRPRSVSGREPPKSTGRHKFRQPHSIGRHIQPGHLYVSSEELRRRCDPMSLMKRPSRNAHFRDRLRLRHFRDHKHKTQGKLMDRFDTAPLQCRMDCMIEASVKTD